MSTTTNERNGSSKSKAATHREHLTSQVKQHVAQAVAHTRRISMKVAEHIPADTKRGFSDGRKIGNNAVRALPYAAGLGVGVGFGVAESVIDAASLPVRTVFGLIGKSLCGDSNLPEEVLARW